MKVDVNADISDYNNYDDISAQPYEFTEKEIAVLQSFFSIAMNRDTWGITDDMQWDAWGTFLSSIFAITDGVALTMEFAIASYVLPANVGAFSPTGSVWNNIPLNTISVQDAGSWASLVGGATTIRLDSGSYFVYAFSRYYFNADYGLRMYSVTGSTPLSDASTITSQATVETEFYLPNVAIFNLALQSDVTLQLYTTNSGQGLPVAFSSTNFASVVIAKLA